MKNLQSSSLCPLCKGEKQAGKTTFTVGLGFGVVVVRDVPAIVCSQCGADWITDNIAEKLEKLVKEAKSKHHQVKIISFLEDAA